MGCSLQKFRNCSSTTDTNNVIVSPDHSKFEIIRTERNGKFLIVELKYLDYHNYDGHKIIVFEDLTLQQLLELKDIDPHFNDNRLGYKHTLKIVARFIPSIYGWYLARKMCHSVLLASYTEERINNLFK